MRTVTNPKLLDDLSLLDPILNSDSWQTLMTFTRESARKFLIIFPNTPLAQRFSL
jgi:hypothetical protein